MFGYLLTHFVMFDALFLNTRCLYLLKTFIYLFNLLFFIMYLFIYFFGQHIDSFLLVIFAGFAVILDACKLIHVSTC